MRALIAFLLLIALLGYTSIFSAGHALTAGSITVAEKSLDSQVEDIQWADLLNVFIITQKGGLYHSEDGGKTFVNQQGKFPEGITHVNSMFIHEKDPKHILFVGSHKNNFMTSDMGKTYSPIASLEISDVRMHPTRAERILASSMSAGCHETLEGPSGVDCYKILHVSKDFGATWQPILNYVVQFDWSLPVGNPESDGSRPSDEIIYVTAHEHHTGNQRFGVWDKNIHFYVSHDYFHTSQILVPHGNRFLFGDYAYLFVAAVDPQEETQVTLKISRDNETRLHFHSARLPGNIHLTEHSYTILDTSEGAVFLHVNHLPFADNAYAGHVYTSDWSGLSYSLSLPYNHRSADGKCDFEKVEGLEGIYLANFIDEELMEQEGQAMAVDMEEKEEERLGSGKHGSRGNRNLVNIPKRDRLRTKTVITFDKGGEWSYLVPPSHDSLGHPIQCTGDCHLHLHGVTDAYGPFYSAASATGLIMATGVVGAYLQQHPDQINTYLSRDAGLTWFEVAKGSHIYEFGNHGAIIVMAPDSQRTDSILASHDEGLTWISYKISDHPIQVENIIIEPEANSRQFIIYGFKNDGDNVGIAIWVDFDTLHPRECKGHDNPDTEESDYETWTPSDKRLSKCLMGRTVTYTRRKRAAQCSIPEIFERPIFVNNCPCTAEDFECDYGYERERLDAAGVKASASQSATGGGDILGECKPMNVPPAHPDPSTPHGDPCANHAPFYRITRGYRRVPGDTCDGGAQWDALIAPCPGWLGGHHVGKVILILLVLLVISLIAVLLGSKQGFAGHDNHPIMQWINKFKARFTTVKYRIVGQEEPHSMADDDQAFYLSEDEFGPSAHLIDENTDAHKRSAAAAASASSSSSGSIKPLPSKSTSKSSVPILSAPPTADS